MRVLIFTALFILALACLYLAQRLNRRRSRAMS
jgi:hypothetical protein